jgi:dienelactone hydrolase
MKSMGGRSRTRARTIAFLAAAALVASVAGGCASDDSGSDASGAPTRGSTFPKVVQPSTFTEIPTPPGAYTEDGADHWYRSPAPDGRSVELGVYLPDPSFSSSPPTVLVLHGGDGLRRTHEDLARAYARAGFIGVVGCWFDQPDGALGEGAVSCSGGPTFKGTSSAAAGDVDSLVHALDHLPEVDTAQIAIVGHSYGGAVALMRASDTGSTQPIIAVSAPLASTPACCPLRKGDRYPLDHAGEINGPVYLMHAEGDPIALVGQAQAFDAARPATAVRYYPRPAGHAFPWQTDQIPGAPAGTTFASQFMADSVAWLTLQFS